MINNLFRSFKKSYFNSKGASLLEVMIAMVILTVGFLGVMALSVALTNNNATASKVNTATAIAQAEVSQLNCLGVSGIQPAGNPDTVFGVSIPGSYTYTVSPTISTPDARDVVANCINPVLAVGGSAPDSLPPTGLGITMPYIVTINFSTNPNTTSTPVINAEVEVVWYNSYKSYNPLVGVGEHMIIMNDIIS